MRKGSKQEVFQMAGLSINTSFYLQPVVLAFNDRDTKAEPKKKMSPVREGVWENYPDLPDKDKAIIADYLEAIGSLSSYSKEYKALRNRVIKRIGEYYAQCEGSPIGSRERIGSIVKLQDFSPVTRMYDINLSDIRSISGNPDIGKITYSSGKLPVNLNAVMNRVVEIPVEELPEEIKSILIKAGWWDYVRNNINSILFAPRLNNNVKSLAVDDIGTAGELIRCALVDSFSEIRNLNRKPWDIANTLVVEAAHIELFYKYSGNKAALGYNFNERYGCAKNYAFLKDLLDLPETIQDKQDIRSTIKFVCERMRGFNKKLNLDKENFSSEVRPPEY